MTDRRTDRQTDRQTKLLVFGINFQIHSVSLTSLVLIHLLIHLSTHLCHHPTHLSHHPRSHYPSFLHSFSPGSKPTFSTNPFHLRLLPTGLPYDNGTITLIILFLVSHFNFLFIPCGRLSWLLVSFLLYVKYTQYRFVSYRMLYALTRDRNLDRPLCVLVPRRESTVYKIRCKS